MINKRRAIPLIVVIFLVCIVLALGLYHVFTSFNIKLDMNFDYLFRSSYMPV